jgi:hypothetical protein
MSTASGRTVFVLGSDVEGNREVLVVEDGDTYYVDADTASTYAAQDARFPYTLPV